MEVSEQAPLSGECLDGSCIGMWKRLRRNNAVALASFKRLPHALDNMVLLNERQIGMHRQAQDLRAQALGF